MIYAVVAYALAGVIWAVYLFSLRVRAARVRERRRDGGP